MNFRRDEKEIYQQLRSHGWSVQEARKHIFHERRKARVSTINEREKRIVEMRVERQMSIPKIAQEEDISPQRVSQILKRLEQVHGIRFPTVRSSKITVHVAARCVVCKKIVEIPERKHSSKKIYKCSEHKRVHGNSVKYAQLCPNWVSMTSSEKTRWKYHNDPEYRKMHGESVKKYHARVKNDPAFKKRVSEYTKKWIQRKIKENPNYFKERDAEKKRRNAARIAELRARLSVIHNGDKGGL